MPDEDHVTVIRYRAGCLVAFIAFLLVCVAAAAVLGVVTVHAFLHSAGHGVWWVIWCVWWVTASLAVVGELSGQAVSLGRLVGHGRLEVSDEGVRYYYDPRQYAKFVPWEAIIGLHGHDSWRVRCRRQQDGRAEDLVVWHAVALQRDRYAARDTVIQRAGLTRRSLSLLWGLGYSRSKPW